MLQTKTRIFIVNYPNKEGRFGNLTPLLIQAFERVSLLENIVISSRIKRAMLNAVRWTMRICYPINQTRGLSCEYRFAAGGLQ